MANGTVINSFLFTELKYRCVFQQEHIVINNCMVISVIKFIYCHVCIICWKSSVGLHEFSEFLISKVSQYKFKGINKKNNDNYV